MNALRIDGTIDSPDVFFDPETHVFTISGISHPENAKEFYDVILDWLDEFNDSVADKSSVSLTIEFNFRYINSTSYRYLRDVMKKIANFHRNGMGANIIWKYHEDDEDLLNEGVVLFELPDINLPFQCVPYS